MNNKRMDCMFNYCSNRGNTTDYLVATIVTISKKSKQLAEFERTIERKSYSIKRILLGLAGIRQRFSHPVSQSVRSCYCVTPNEISLIYSNLVLSSSNLFSLPFNRIKFIRKSAANVIKIRPEIIGR